MGFEEDFVAHSKLGLYLVRQMFDPEKIQYLSQAGCFYHHFQFSVADGVFECE